MNNIDPQYQALLQNVLNHGYKKQTRNGETLSVFGRVIRHNMKEGFLLLTTKKMHWKSIVVELLWFLRGDTNIKYLVDNDVHIWDGDAYKNYISTRLKISDINKSNPVVVDHFINNVWGTQKEFINRIKTDDEFAKKWGELGPIYGKQWRSWEGNGSPLTRDYEGNVSSYLVKSIDQIANLINDLKTNPDSRRLMVNAWNVGELDQMVLPPCHYGFQVYTRELSLEEQIDIGLKRGWDAFDLDIALGNGKLSEYNIPTRAISLMWNQRSVDLFLGLPFNIASYALLLQIIAKEVNMVPEEVIGNLGDVHLYVEHIEQAMEQITRTPYELPKLLYKDEFHYLMDMNIPFVDKINKFEIDFFKIENYQSHPTIKAPLIN